MFSEMAISCVSYEQLPREVAAKFNLLNYEHISDKNYITWYLHAESINFILWTFKILIDGSDEDRRSRKVKVPRD